MGTRSSLADLPGWALPVVVVLGVVEVGLLVVALIRLVRTPQGRLTLPMWAWALIIVFVSTLGPIAFLVAGRRPPELSGDVPRAAGSGRASSAADLLYGPKPPTDPGARA